MISEYTQSAQISLRYTLFQKKDDFECLWGILKRSPKDEAFSKGNQ